MKNNVKIVNLKNLKNYFFYFRIILTAEQTNHFIVHLFGFIFDLTIGFWMMFDKTRLPAMLVCTAFHLMNTRLFAIGMKNKKLK